MTSFRIAAVRPLALFAVLLLAFGLTASSARAQVDVPDVYESTATAGGVHVEVAVPAFFEAFGPYSSSEASNDASHSYHAPLYLGFFLTAAAEQFGFPPPPGTSETLFPQGPTEAGTPQTPVDANGFESSGRSTATGASGSSVITRGAVAPLFDIGLGKAESSVQADAGGVTAKSSLVMEGVGLSDGLFSIDHVLGSAQSRATGKPGEGTAAGTITLSGIRLAGIPIDLPIESLPTGDELPLGGITIERLADERTLSPDGQIAEIHLGGFRITIDQPAAEFKFSVTIGDLIARSRVVDLADPSPLDTSNDETVAPSTVGATTSTPVVGRTPGEESLITRTVVTSTPVRGGNWIAIAALSALAAPFLLIVRRAYKAAVRP
jgi:hypothetical protein